ncbi:MAG: VanZ family protein [Elusimicrobia bacterium]|nr:VanZ family protein [Elusimicrobiota bacterium]
MKFIKLWLPVFVWGYIIYFLSDIPGLGIGLGILDLILRKGAHVTEYFILTILLIRAFRRSFRMSFAFLIFWPSLISFLYAVSDEYHQTFIKNRCGTPWDVLVDAVGILIVVYLYIKKGNVKNEN